MDIQTVLRQHAEGFYDQIFEGYRNSTYAMTGYVAHNDDPEGSYRTRGIVQGACHAAVNSAIYRDKALAVITMADNKLENDQGAIQFYDWLINKSFFSDVFLCKDPVLSLRHGFVKRVDVSAAKWLGAAQLARLSTSEFKKFMHAVYDILASGYDIHPMLLLLVATELNLVSDKKTVKATRTSRVKSLRDSLHSSNSAHLPLVYAESVAALKDMCKDDPNKPFGWVNQISFTEGRWPSNSNYILSPLAKEYTGRNEFELQQSFSEIMRGNGSMLFNTAAEVVEVDYTSLWQDAIDELKSFIITDKADSNGVPINLTPIEMLSKQLKLGE
jgi:hypothetical protein